MKTDLLTSKFYYPSPRLDIVPRPHLFDNLGTGLRGKLTLVSAPAGFGKTTLVSEWIRACGHPAAWLSLDKNDNDPSRFLIYLIAALQYINPQIGVDIQAVLEETQPPQLDILLTRLISEIARLPEKSILVLDDYHLIDSKHIHDIINFLVEYLPASIHLVISGRTDPPLPISRLRVQGEVNEVRTSQLRFTRQEVAAYLNNRLDFDLPSDDITALETRTEGWVASLKLAAISMRGRHDWPEFIAKFSGSNRFVIDYLVDEVMARQSEEVQNFLRRTSILERFCASLCEYVVGESQDFGIIDYLDRSNLFLIPLDDHREWYRYHHLFADFLSQRLRETERDTIPELHRRASEWFKKAGLVDEAIHHALSGGDVEGAARLVDEIAADLIVRGEANKLVKFVEQLPPDICRGYPMLSICHAWALFFLGQLAKVEPVLEFVEANQKEAPRVLNPGYVTTVRAYLANRKGDLDQSIKLTEQALEELSTAAPDRITLIFQGSAVVWLGVNQLTLGNLEKGRQLLLEAVEINQKAGNYFGILGSFENLANLAVIRGQLHQALEFFQSGLKLAQNWRHESGKSPGVMMPTAGLQLGVGTVLYQWNDLDGAAAHIQHSKDIFELGGYWGRNHAYTMLAFLKQAQGEFEASVELFRKAYALEEALFIRPSKTSYFPRLTKLAILLSRERPELAHLLKDMSQRVKNLGVHETDEVDFTDPADYSRQLIYADLACLLIAQDRADEALPLIMRLLEAADKMGRLGDETRYLVMMALAQHALGNTQTALDALCRALILAEPEGYIRLFVDEGLPMAELLSFAISQNVAPDYASKLLAAFPKEVLSAAQIDQELVTHKLMLVEPLSEREIEVLRLIAEGYKYQEIAERLVVSINTVRYHTRNVYSKLGVNNRTQAIGRAKELNLL